MGRFLFRTVDWVVSFYTNPLGALLTQNRCVWMSLGAFLFSTKDLRILGIFSVR